MFSHRAGLFGLALALCGLMLGGGAAAMHETWEIFPPQELHVHGSYIVELPNGALLSCWFQGTGERWADDVQVLGARKNPGDDEWSEPFLMADTRGFPDCNPVLFMDGEDRLWLMWYAVLANQWETSLLRYRISTNYEQTEGPPEWDWQESLVLKPGDSTERGIQPDDSFVRTVEEKIADYVDYHPPITGVPEERRQDMAEQWIERTMERAAGKDMIRSGRIYDEDGGYESGELGYPLSRRIGWQTMNKPVILDGGRMIVPLYSDGFSFSIMAITDDWGENWFTSEPLVGFGNIQPAIAEKEDGTLVAYMRDNGPPPKRLHMSESTDRGETWSPVRYSELPNSGTGADIVTLDNGDWLLVYNDLEQDRYSLAAAISEDGGETWPWKRHLERDERGAEATRSHYPAVIQAADGSIHVTYSYHHNDRPREESRTIKHAHFTVDWVKEGN